jgi:hypothetical protein
MSANEVSDKRPSIADARIAVRDCLQQLLPDARKVVVTRLVQLDPHEGTWDAEAEVWHPNAAIEALGLPTQHPVLDRELYAVRLDGQLNVVGYEIRGAE